MEAAALAQDLQEWLEAAENPVGLPQDEEQNLIGGRVARFTLGERYLEARMEFHVHVLWASDLEFQYECALFHGADVLPDLGIGEFADRSPTTRRVRGEVRASVLVEIAELVEEGKGIAVRSHPSVVRLRALNQCQYVRRETLERFSHLVSEFKGVFEDGKREPRVRGTALVTSDQGPKDLIHGRPTVVEEFPEGRAPDLIGVGGTIADPPTSLLGVKVELLLNRAGVIFLECVERRPKAFEVFLSVPELLNESSLIGRSHGA